jgi:hypothetical protein
MGSSRSVAVRTCAYEQEWADAALVEQVELLEAQVASLETERSRLETELSIAQRWVKELALWLDEAQLPTGVKLAPGTPATTPPKRPELTATSNQCGELKTA